MYPFEKDLGCWSRRPRAMIPDRYLNEEPYVQQIWFGWSPTLSGSSDRTRLTCPRLVSSNPLLLLFRFESFIFHSLFSIHSFSFIFSLTPFGLTLVYIWLFLITWLFFHSFVLADGSFVETSSGAAAREIKRRYDQYLGVGKDVQNRSPFAIIAFVNQHGRQMYRVG